MAERLAGKVAIVTGGASGIGRGIALRFAAEGAAVMVMDVDAAGGAETCEQIGATGGQAFAITADVTREADWRRAVEATVDGFGSLDTLVNNAGTAEAHPLAETDESVWDRIHDVNLKGIYLGWKAALPALATAGGGTVINLASITATVAVAGLAAYCAAKAGVVQLTRVLALEGAPFQVRANALCPTWVWTPLVARSRGDVDPEAAQSELAATIPLGRIATVEDVAAAAVFLASDEAAFLTGVALPIDGGSAVRLR